MVDRERRRPSTAAARSCRHPTCHRSACAARPRRGRAEAGRRRPCPIGNGRPYRRAASQCSVTHSADGMPTPSTSSSGAVRGIDVASERRRGVADRCQGPRHPVGDVGAQLLDVDLPVGDLGVGRPQRADERRARAPGGRRGSRWPGAGPRRRCRRARSPRSRPPDTRRAGGPRRPGRARGGHRARPRSTASAVRRPPAPPPAPAEVEHLEQAAQHDVGFGAVVATCGPAAATPPTACAGSHLSQPLSGRSPTAATIVRSSGLCRQAAWMTIDDATPFDHVVGAVEADHPTLGEVDRDRHAVDLVEAGERAPAPRPGGRRRRRAGAPGVNDRRRASRGPARSRRKSGLSRLRAQRSTVRSSARRASSARSGAVRTRSMRSASTSASSSRSPGDRDARGTSPVRRGSASAPSACRRPSWRPSRAATSASAPGTAPAARTRTASSPAASGARTASTWNRRWSPRSGIGPSSGTSAVDTTGGRYGVRWNSIWPSWSTRSPSARTNRRNDNRVPPRPITSVSSHDGRARPRRDR